MRRILASLAILLTLASLASCSASATALTDAQGVGSYSGTFTGGGGGDLTLRVRDSGQLTGSGTLGVYEVELRGVLTPEGEVVAFITEALSQHTGEFNGTRNGIDLSGTWSFDPSGTQVVSGQWSAALNP